MRTKLLYPHLKGLAAKLSDGTIYGTIVAVYNFGAGEVIEIEKPKGKIEMLPLREPFAIIEEKGVTVFPPEYLEANKE